MNKLSKIALKAILPVFILAKAAFPSDISGSYGSINGKNQGSLIADFNGNPIVFVNPSGSRIDAGGRFKFNVKDFSIQPGMSYQSDSLESGYGKDISNSTALDLGLEKRINENINLFGNLTSINESAQSEFSESTQGTEHIADSNSSYDITTANRIHLDTLSESKGTVLRFGADLGNSFDAYAESRDINVLTRINGNNTTTVTLDGRIANTDIYQVTQTTSPIYAENNQKISQISVGGSYYFSMSPLLAKIGVSQDISSVGAEASNSSFKMELKTIIPIGDSEEFYDLSDYKANEKEINKYKRDYVLNSTIDNITRLKERGYSAVVASVDTDSNLSVSYISPKLRGRLEYKNKGDISVSAGYKAFDANVTKTREGGTNFTVSATVKLE